MASESDKTSALIEDYIAQGKDSLSMVIAGKMGTGKSSLINGVVGRKVAKEGASAVTQTTEIEPYEAKVVTSAKTVTITVWDTPGLGDVFGDDEGADMDHSYDSEASSGDEGNSNDEANSDDDPMDVDSNVELFVYICVSSMCCFALQQLMLINIS